MIVTCEEMQAAEAALFASGVAEAGPLMEKAGFGCARAVRQWFPRQGRARLFVGHGNNGGDALVVGRHLIKAGWEVDLRLAAEPERMSELAAAQLTRFLEAQAAAPSRGLARGAGRRVLIDGLLGIGARGPLRGAIADLANEMNATRDAEQAFAFAIDLPSGIDGDEGTPHPGAVVADVTLCIAQIKAGLVAEPALDHVGRLVRIPLEEIPMDGRGRDDLVLLDPARLLEWLPAPRRFGTHKGSAGRVLILAGSLGLTGAARLAGLGALRGGAGLVSVLVPKTAYPVVASSMAPEVMVRPWSGSLSDALDARPHDVIAAGPGLGDALDSHSLAALLQRPVPLVLDADALNAVARSGDANLSLDPVSTHAPRLLTPHPGEMARLLGGLWPEGCDRLEVARSYASSHPETVLLLKGARTLVAKAGRPTLLNGSGHPGMASGGMGDVLTGLLAALLAQGWDAREAAGLGSWLLGRAAESCLSDGGASAESLSAAQVADRLGVAFDSLREGGY